MVYPPPGKLPSYLRSSTRVLTYLNNSIDVIKKLEYAAPTSIQAQAIPAIMSGRDIIGVAKTGSGKTIAFLLPMLRHVKDQRALRSMEGPIAMIMTPTRELATQIFKECKPFLKALGLRVRLQSLCRSLSAATDLFVLSGFLRVWWNSAQRQHRRYETGLRISRVYSRTYDRTLDDEFWSHYQSSASYLSSPR